MTDLVFVQMSGAPGAGKTTVAQAVARRIGAIVIDHDVTKSALLEANVPVAITGAASYSVLNAVARHLLQQGHSVIFDSPCFYEELLERGQQLAREAHAQYRYVECVVADLEELDRRLRTRSRMPSQLAGVWASPTAGSGRTRMSDDVFRDWIANMKRPVTGYLTLDTTQSLDMCVDAAVAYIEKGGIVI